MGSPVSSDDKHIGESGKPLSFSCTSPQKVSFTQDKEKNHQQILNEAEHFFNQNENNYSEHSRFFERFIEEWILLLTEDKYNSAEQIWKSAVIKAREWENKKKKRIHKGTVYYFLGLTCILKDDLEKGFLYMHQALGEDKLNSAIIKFDDTPSHAFVTLNYQQQRQFFYEKVMEISDFVESQLNIYQNDRGGSLNLSDMRSKLLSTSDLSLLDIVFLLVYQIFHAEKLLTENALKIADNVYGNLLIANTIFSLCLVIESIIKHKIPQPVNARYPQIIHSLHHHSLYSTKPLTLKQNDLESFNQFFQSNFSNILEDLLLSKYTSGVYIPPHNSVEEDFVITYGFRNFGAHRIENQPIITKYFKEVLDRVLNALFFAIERKIQSNIVL